LATFNIKSIKLIGGFAGNEGAPEQRDIESNLTVLSGDIIIHMQIIRMLL
jgi:hypothetical protein